MPTIADWYESQGLVKQASTDEPGASLLKQAGIVKEAGWIGRLAGKALKVLGGSSSKVGWKLGSKVTPGGLASKTGAKLATEGKKMRDVGKSIRSSTKDTTSMEDIARFQRSKYFLPAAMGGGGLAVGMGTGYALGKD